MALPAQREWTPTGAVVAAQPSLCRAQFQAEPQHKASSPRVPGVRSGGAKHDPQACARAAGLTWHRSFHMSKVAPAPTPVRADPLPVECGHHSLAIAWLEEHQEEGQGRQGCQHRHGTQHGHTVSSPNSTRGGWRRTLGVVAGGPWGAGWQWSSPSCEPGAGCRGAQHSQHQELRPGQEQGGWGRVAEGGCCLCGRRRLSPGWQRCAQCTLQHSQGSPIPAALGCPAPAALKGPGSALTLALWRGIQSHTVVGHRASAESAQHSPASRIHSHREVPSPQRRSQLSVSSGCQHLTALAVGLPHRAGACACSKPCEHTHQVPCSPRAAG